MAQYLGQRIIDGAYTYTYVVSKRSDLKTGIDAYLMEKSRTDLMSAQIH